MGSRDKDQKLSHHQPLLSSLVVRPSASDGADGGGGGGGGRGGGSDYEPGEVRREPPPYSRSDRYNDEPAVNVACKNLGLDEGMLGLMFCAKCHLFVLGMMNELVVLITKDKLLHLGFEAIITCVSLGKSLKIVTMGLDRCKAWSGNQNTDNIKVLDMLNVLDGGVSGNRQWSVWGGVLLGWITRFCLDGSRIIISCVKLVEKVTGDISIYKKWSVNDALLLGIEEALLVSTFYPPGYRIRAGSSSPVRRRDADHRYGSNFDRSGGPSRSRDFGNGRDPGRYRDSSPPYNRGPGGGRPLGRGFDGPGYGPGPFRGEGMTRNNPNVRPREGDWVCPDPLCRNLNFARREYCNNCRRFRYAPVGSPRGGYPGPPPSHAPPRRFPGSPMDLSPPGRNMNGFRSPPRGWAREGPREFGAGGPPPSRHEGRFSDHSMRRDRLDFLDDDYRGRNRFDRPMPMDWGHRDRGRENFFNERKGYERRPPSPPPPPPQLPPRGRWPRDVRERSRSPVRGAPPPKEYRRDMYLERGREDRRGVGRDRMGDAY
ncbi:hypothetical protein QQP08_024075 [Theobroma cacao]|nr:hypothetical protein QQP08_024075 [Theobroma cacao]